MPIKIQSDLPVKEILEKENIFVMDEGRAVHQDIRLVSYTHLDVYKRQDICTRSSGDRAVVSGTTCRGFESLRVCLVLWGKALE